MADGTKIEWTDATWNVVNGCSVTSPGCTNCYAMKQAHRVDCRRGLTVPSKGGMVWTGETRFNDKVLLDPIRWKRPRRIFVCAHGDLFHDSVPDEWIDRVFAVMALAPQHQFQVLTKRAARMRGYLRHRWADDSPERWEDAAYWRVSDQAAAMDRQRYNESPIGGCGWWPLRNVWLGVSVEDQARADERIPDLLATPAAVRWLSCEPLLGPVDLRNMRERQPLIGATLIFDSLEGTAAVHSDHDIEPSPIERLGAKIDWVVAGGESGHGARPMHPDWARSLRDQCAAAGVPFLFKQWGEYAPALNGPLIDEAGGCAVAWPDSTIGTGNMGSNGGRGVSLDRLGKKLAGRDLDGVTHDGFPA